ncbi:DUF2975 domain-containing protein [Chitinibacteraceae bacterium HSL-7]
MPLARRCLCLAMLCSVCAALLALIHTIFWFSPSFRAFWQPGLGMLLSERMAGYIPNDPGTLTVIGGWLLAAIPLAALLIGLIQLRRLFAHYGAGAYFAPEAARSLALAGRALLAWVLLDMLMQPLLSVWLTYGNPVGQRVISIGFDGAMLAALLLAAIIAAVAEVLRQASELALENEQFV